MQNITIDLNVLELGEDENPFEKLAAKIEQLNLQGADPDKTGVLEQQVLFLERKYQDLQDTDLEKAKVLLQACKANILMLDSDVIHSFDAIKKNINSITHVTMGMLHSKKSDVSSLLLSKILKEKFHNSSSISAIALYDVFNSTFNTSSVENIIVEPLEWLIELNFKTDKKENHKPLEFIHTFIEGLNTIPGVRVTLEDIKIGSIQAKIKAIFDDVTSKEEVKEVLETARKFAKGKLEKEYYEGEKASSETQKNKIEFQILEENLLNLKSEENKELKKLQSESIRYDIEKKQLENERLKIQLFKERKELLKELLVDGFIQQKDLELLIKGIPFLKIENGRLTAGESTDIIDKL